MFWFPLSTAGTITSIFPAMRELAARPYLMAIAPETTFKESTYFPELGADIFSVSMLIVEGC